MSKTIASFYGVVHPWLCDANGHLTTRHYVGMFDDAMQSFFGIIGYEPIGDLGWVDLQHNIRYESEILPGELVRVECELKELGTKSIKYSQHLIIRSSNKVAAVNDAVSVVFDRKDRKAVAIPDVIRNYYQKYYL